MEEVDGTVDDDFVETGFGGEDLLDGAARGEFETGGEAVAVELGGGNPAEAAGGSVGEDDFVEGSAPNGGEAFGVVEGEIGVVDGGVFGVKKIGAENHGANDERSRPRAAANFINAEDDASQD